MYVKYWCLYNVICPMIVMKYVLYKYVNYETWWTDFPAQPDVWICAGSCADRRARYKMMPCVWLAKKVKLPSIGHKDGHVSRRSLQSCVAALICVCHVCVYYNLVTDYPSCIKGQIRLDLTLFIVLWISIKLQVLLSCVILLSQFCVRKG